MHPCPSCGSPIDDEGFCPSCGALVRGFFLGLNLGAPQLADAVARGLDFYHLLGVDPASDVRVVARRYRQLRALFPDSPARLQPVPARRLALLEAAGRVLTDPNLRQMYDQLRARGASAARTEVIRCQSCSAPLPAAAAACPYCGTPRPREESAPIAPPEVAPGSLPPPTDPVDYYALLGLTPVHLVAAQPDDDSSDQYLVRAAFGHTLAPWMRADRDATEAASCSPTVPPTPGEIDSAALQRQQEVLLAHGYTPEQREARVAEFEIGRRILRDDRLRGQYDLLWLRLSRGQFDQTWLEALHHMQEDVRAQIAEERGERPSGAQGQALLQQAVGFLRANLPREAVPLLGRAIRALPDSAEAHAAYVQALLRADDPLMLGGHELRQLLASLDRLTHLGAPLSNHTALTALCRGLLARDAGDTSGAEAALQAAVRDDSGLAAAWRGLAALALARGATEEVLSYCRRALARDPRDERALMLIVGACVRAGRHQQAHEAAAQIAQLRGDGCDAHAVLGELTH